jgi:hypothetical protein
MTTALASSNSPPTPSRQPHPHPTWQAFRFVRHNACHETIFRRPADETEVLADLTARSKALGATLTAEDDRVRIAP